MTSPFRDLLLRALGWHNAAPPNEIGPSCVRFEFGSAHVDVRVNHAHGGFFAWVPGNTGAWGKDRNEAITSALAVAVHERVIA
jgi:hypothetical protein